MKKIILILMIMVSFAFSSGAPTYINYSGSWWKKGEKTATYADQSSSPTEHYEQKGYYVTYITVREFVLNGNNYSSGGIYFYGFNQNWYNYYKADNDCPAPSTIVDGECVAPVDPLECDPTKGTFTNLDGQCADCSSHLADSTVNGMANCACGASGSSWNNGTVYSNSVSSGGKTYWQAPINCTDGSKKFVYWGEATPSDNNSTTPPSDNNSSTPNDNNSSIPTDNNGTKIPTDGNGTKIPTDGNGTGGASTGSGKDYTSLLKDILGTLGNIRLDTKGITDGINGDYAVIPNTHTIPTETTGGDWNTYQETWGNIVDSLGQVNEKVNEFKGLINGGFTSPFSKTTVTTCVYSTSFEFGEIGSIPLSVDLCKVFSPLHGVIYTFAYLFFVFNILLFSVKMFLRLL